MSLCGSFFREPSRKFDRETTGCLSCFSSSLRASPLESKHEQKEHDQTQPTSPAIGSYVQWESKGQLQFQEPKRVRALSPDGQWAFVDGSDTGLSIGELTVMDAPSPTVEKPLERTPLLRPPGWAGEAWYIISNSISAKNTLIRVGAVRRLQCQTGSFRRSTNRRGYRCAGGLRGDHHQSPQTLAEGKAS